MDQSHPFLAGSLKDQQNQTFFPNCRKKSPSQKMAQEILRFDIEEKLHWSFGARCHHFVFYQTQLQCKYACRSPVNEINCNKESFLGSQ